MINDISPFRTVRIGRHLTVAERKALIDSRNVLKDILAPSGWWIQASWNHKLDDAFRLLEQFPFLRYEFFAPQHYMGWDRKGPGEIRMTTFYGWIVCSWGGGGEPPTFNPHLPKPLGNYLRTRVESADFMNSFPKPFLAMFPGKRPQDSSFPDTYWLSEDKTLPLKKQLQNLKYSIQWDKPAGGVF